MADTITEILIALGEANVNLFEISKINVIAFKVSGASLSQSKNASH